MFSVRSVCLSVRRITRKLGNGFWQNFFGGVGHGSRTKWYNFGGDPDHASDPGIQSPTSGSSGSAEVCPLWVHFCFLFNLIALFLTVDFVTFNVKWDIDSSCHCLIILYLLFLWSSYLFKSLCSFCDARLYLLTTGPRVSEWTPFSWLQCLQYIPEPWAWVWLLEEFGDWGKDKQN